MARFLETGLVIDSSNFPGFRRALEPAEINWDHDPAPFTARAQDIENGEPCCQSVCSGTQRPRCLAESQVRG